MAIKEEYSQDETLCKVTAVMADFGITSIVVLVMDKVEVGEEDLEINS